MGTANPRADALERAIKADLERAPKQMNPERRERIADLLMAGGAR